MIDRFVIVRCLQLMVNIYIFLIVCTKAWPHTVSDSNKIEVHEYIYVIKTRNQRINWSLLNILLPIFIKESIYSLLTHLTCYNRSLRLLILSPLLVDKKLFLNMGALNPNNICLM